ncbi:GGDEF domain-containing protein [bacterium]|nr:MAG: GGDEF domain-containing protein [bacterium]
MTSTEGSALGDAPDTRASECEALRRELASARECLARAEAERDELARQNSELFILQQVFSAINSTLELDDILSMVMRGIREALGYQRVVLLDVEGGAVTPRMATEPDGSVEPLALAGPLALDAESPLLCVATGKFELYVAHESLPPLTSGSTFCLVPLVARDAIRGVLFVDGRDGEITDDSVRVLLDFASQAAMAIESARLFHETKRLALVDHLTGLANARQLHDQMEHTLALARRHGQPLCFVILDLDDLKLINDSQGHAAGDAALRTFAETLKATARTSDLVARYAGDEFVLVMPQTGAVAGVRAVQRVLEALNARGIRASAGLAVYPSDAQNEQELFVAADKALYQAKVEGKNRCSVAQSIR